MNESQARQAGYEFTGSYSHDKEEQKLRAAKVVNVPHNKLSRGHHGMGYSVYFIESEANIAAKIELQRASKISRLMKEMDTLKARMQAIDAEILALT